MLQGVSATFTERERDFFVLLYCNTQSYCIRERFVSLSYINKSDTFFLSSSIVFNSFFVLQFRRIEVKDL